MILEETLGATRPLIAVVHLLPLPGSHGWGGDIQAVVDRAMRDARAIEDSGFDAVILENFGDAPFARGFAGRGAVAGLAAVAARVGERLSIPVGINVLRSDAVSAVAVASAVGASFIRVNVHIGAAVTDQGIIQGDARETLLAMRDLHPRLAVLADVFVKHAKPLGSASIEQSSIELVERGKADALIVTGVATGSPSSLDQVRRVQAAVPGVPVIVGSGVTAETVADVIRTADGVIVGSAIMEGGRAAHPVDLDRASAFVAAAGAAAG
jgi:membrane complex biogenesis BtpA family protein